MKKKFRYHWFSSFLIFPMMGLPTCAYLSIDRILFGLKGVLSGAEFNEGMGPLVLGLLVAIPAMLFAFSIYQFRQTMYDEESVYWMSTLGKRKSMRWDEIVAATYSLNTNHARLRSQDKVVYIYTGDGLDMNIISERLPTGVTLEKSTF